MIREAEERFFVMLYLSPERVVMRETTIWNHVCFIVDDDICESAPFNNDFCR